MSCFQWTSGQIYDTELLKWVDTCVAPKIMHNDSQYSLSAVWRSQSIYINPQSSSIIEFGTMKYPYKNSINAFSEIINQYSHSNYNISVYIKENTQLMITKDISYFINITSVSISSYSNSLSTPNSATIILTETLPSQTIKTQFCILSSTNLKLGSKISQGTFTTVEKQSILINKSIFNILRANFSINNVIISTNLLSNNIFINFVSTKVRQLNIDHLYFNTSESILNNYESITPILSILNVLYPTNAVIQNVQIDASRLKSGFVFDIDCNYPEAVLLNEVIFNNITAFYSQTKTSYDWARIIHYQGPANVTISNLNFANYFSSYDNYKSSIYITSSKACQPNDGAIQSITLNGATLSLQNYPISIPLFNGVYMSLQFSIYRIKVVTISNFKFINYAISSGPMVYLTGYQTDELYYLNNYHYNFDPQSELIMIDTFNIVNITNSYFGAGSELENSIFDLHYINNVLLNNVTFVNVNNTSGVENNIIALSNFETTTTTLTNLNVSNWFINSGLIVSSHSPLDKLSLLNSNFNQIYIENNANLIIIENIKSIEFINLTIQKIIWTDFEDIESRFMLITDLNLEGDLNSTIKNVTLSDSNISFFDIDSINNEPTSWYYFTITNATLKSLTYTNPKNLIHFHNFAYRINMIFTFQNWEFSNIYFDYNGKLFRLQQRLFTSVLIYNSTFHNLTSTSIYLDPPEVHDDAIVAWLTLNDCTFNNINSVYGSFMVASEVAYITINSCIFSNIYSYENAAIIYGTYDETHISISDSVFKNITAVESSAFIFEEYAEVYISNWTFENNFALESGIVSVMSTSQATFTNCTIKNNYAVANPIAIVFEGYSILNFINCTISNNMALTKDQVLYELNTLWNKLWFVPILFINYVNSNPGVFGFSYSQAAINSVYSRMNFYGTSIQNQNTLIYSIISEIIIENSSLSNVTVVAEPNISLVYSSLSILNSTISGVVSTQGFDFIRSIEDWTIRVISSKFYDSNSSLINTISTVVEMQNVIIEQISSSRPIIAIDSSNSNVLNAVSILNWTTQSNWLVSISNWNDSQIMQTNIENSGQTAIRIYSSSISTIQNWSVFNSYQAFVIESSIVSTFKDLLLSSNGDTSSLHGGALRLINVNVSVSNWTFVNNKAQSGAAISFEWESLLNWDLYIENTLFDSNAAVLQGGAIYYNYKRPQLSKINFSNNQAVYGPNIASYAVKVRFHESSSDQMSISYIASGIQYENDIVFELVDYDNQIMVLNNINQVEMSVTNSSRLQLKGTNNGKLKSGVATFSNFKAISKPGNTNILISIKCKAIDSTKILKVFGKQFGSSSLTINFRYCKPGEIQMADNTWSECAAGTYSLSWNSTNCIQWPMRTICLGNYQISVDQGYWRNNKNSTYIAECLAKDSCRGGYAENSEHPILCGEGYTGNLWNDWQISNGIKYQKVSDYVCQKWPNPTFNAIRVIGLLILVFAFLMILIVINIHKSKESEMSILIRIMTNYLQLLTTSMSFNVDYPSALLNALSPVSQVGSSSESFLSFDWFITDSQIKGPFPSNAFFKLFLTGMLPFILIVIISAIWIWVRLIKQSFVRSLTRSIVISFISIVFFLHPKLASSSVSIFEWVQIDEGIYKVRIDTNMECYSSDHIYWWFLLGVPILAFWVIFLPLLALYLLFKNIHKGDRNKINMYFLILYQGLKKDIFYWEFVNTLRKVLILVSFAALATFLPLYKIMISVVILIITARVQIRLNPYKNSNHSEIEMLAIVSGTMTIFSGLIFTTLNNVVILDLLILVWIFVINILFILDWWLLFFISLSERYKFLLKVSTLILQNITLNLSKKF